MHAFNLHTPETESGGSMCVLGKPCLHNEFQHNQIYKVILPQKKAVKSPSPSFRLHLLSLLVFHRICQFNGHSLPFPATCLSFSFPDPSFADPSSPQFYQPALKIWSPRASHARVPDSAVPWMCLGLWTSLWNSTQSPSCLT